MTVSEIDAQHVLTPLQHADRIVVARPFRFIGPQIFVSIPLPGSSEPARPVLYGKHTFFTIGVDIRFRLSPKGKAFLFRIRSRRGSTSTVGTTSSTRKTTGVGLVDKSVRRSQARSHYRLCDASRNGVLVGEESTMVRRAPAPHLGFPPDLLPGPFELAPDVPDHFDLHLEARRVARYERLSLVYDWSLLTLEPELAGVDRRLLVAFVAALHEL